MLRKKTRTLHDHVDTCVVASESVGRNAGEEGGVASFGSLDAQVGQHAVRQYFLPNGVTGIALRVQPLVVHVPQDADRFLALGLALQHGRFPSSCGLVLQFDLEVGWSWMNYEQ